MGNRIKVQLQELSQLDGTFVFVVGGLRNPGTTRRSSTFSDVKVETFDFYPIMQLPAARNAELFVKTEIAGPIHNWELMQSNENFGEAAAYTLNFFPLNPLGQNSIMTLTWTDQVNLSRDASCAVTTFAALPSSACEIDYSKKVITIRGAFAANDGYLSKVTIKLETITNPNTNQGLEFLKVETFDDEDKVYKIDILEFTPQLKCNYPCYRCSLDKDYCYACWQNDVRSFLFSEGPISTCKESCGDGYTVNGKPDKICEPCNVSCKTCSNEDRDTCIECADDYVFRL